MEDFIFFLDNPRQKTSTYFGIKIDNAGNDINYHDLIARLFLCPNITCDHVSYFLSKLETGEMSWEKISELANAEFIYFSISKPSIEEANALTEKITEWEKVFSPLTVEDYNYLEQYYGFKKTSLPFFHQRNKNFNSPKELAAIVKQYVKGQDETIDKLAVLFFMQYVSRINGTNSIIRSALTIGPTGSGKSEIYRRFGLICDFPVLTINSCHITPVGWKGPSLSELILQYKIEKNLSNEEMKYLVIILPEFDKIAHHHQTTDNDYDADQMRQIMQLFDKGNQMVFENISNLASGSNPICKLCTDNWLIVLDGAFAGMEEIVKKRLNLNQSLGFSKPGTTGAEKNNLLKHVNSNDLVQWGFMQELIGRIDEICVLNPLTKDVIYQILVDAKDNIVQSHIDFCKQYNIDLQFTDDALMLIADDATQNPFGFRSVPTSFTKIMTPIYYEHCSSSYYNEKQTIVIDKDYVAKQLKTR